MPAGSSEHQNNSSPTSQENKKHRLKPGRRLSTAFSSGQLVQKVQPNTSDSVLTRRHTDGDLTKSRPPSSKLRSVTKYQGGTTHNKSPSEEAAVSLVSLPEDVVDEVINDDEETMVSCLKLAEYEGSISTQSSGSSLSSMSGSTRLALSINTRSTASNSVRKTGLTLDSGLPPTGLTKRTTTGILLRTQSGSKLSESSGVGKRMVDLRKSRVSSAGALRVVFKSTPEERFQLDGKNSTDKIVNNFIEANSDLLSPSKYEQMTSNSGNSETAVISRPLSVLDQAIEEEAETCLEQVENSLATPLRKNSLSTKKNCKTSKSNRSNSVVKLQGGNHIGLRKRHSQLSVVQPIPDSITKSEEEQVEENSQQKDDDDEVTQSATEIIEDEKVDSKGVSKESKKKKKSASASRTARYGEPVHIFTKPVIDKEYECEGFSECIEIHERLKANGIQIDFEKIKRALLQPGEGRIERYEMNQVALPACSTSNLLSHPSTWFPREWSRLEEARRMNEKMQEAYLLAHSHHRADDSEDDAESAARSRISSATRPVMEAARSSFVNPDVLYSAFARTSVASGTNSGPVSRVSSAANKGKKMKTRRPNTVSSTKSDPLAGVVDQLLINGEPLKNFRNANNSSSSIVIVEDKLSANCQTTNYWKTASDLFS